MVGLHKGLVWKIGKSVNWQRRYSNCFYQNTAIGLNYEIIDKGAESYILFREQMHLRLYKATHAGLFPPGNSKLP